MATLFRALPLLRHRLHLQRRFATSSLSHRPWYTLSEAFRCDDNNMGQNIPTVTAKDPPKRTWWKDDPDYRKWKEVETEILEDLEPITDLTKEILHSQRYRDGERLTVEDEKAVVERLLAYHPHFEDKIGCGLDSIMVDRHPQFRCSRCFFVVRTDGGWIDFSYQKCIRSYIRDKYPSHAERFIKQHFKRGRHSHK